MSRFWNFGPFQVSDDWFFRRPSIGTDEYYQHTVTFRWPFSRRRHTDGDRLYWGLTIWLPSTCRKPLKEELDTLRGWDDFEEEETPNHLRVVEGGRDV